MTQLLVYVLGYAVGLFGLQIHAVVSLSNHVHLVVTDPSGTICAFFERANLLIARAMNCFRGRWGPFWEPGRLSLVELETPDDVLDKLVYLMANPCAEDLVDRASQWPGLMTLPDDIVSQRVFTADRPSGFFRSSGLMPARTEFALSRPPGLDHLSDDELLALLRERLESEEGRHRNRRRREGRRVQGVSRVHKADWNGRATSPEPRRQLDPHLACKDTERRVAALQELQQFRDDYRQARRRFASGKRKVHFPHGTYLLRVRLGVRCRGPDCGPGLPGSQQTDDYTSSATA